MLPTPEDVFGNPIDVGDYIVWAATLKYDDGLRLSSILEIKNYYLNPFGYLPTEYHDYAGTLILKLRLKTAIKNWWNGQIHQVRTQTITFNTKWVSEDCPRFPTGTALWLHDIRQQCPCPRFPRILKLTDPETIANTTRMLRG